MRFDVVKGGAEEARIPKVLAEDEELPEVNAERSWPLTFQGLAGGGSVWQIAGGGFSRDADRLPAAPGLDRAVDVGRTSPSARTRCTCTATTSAWSASTAQPPHPGDRGWKDTVAVYRQPDRRRAAVLRLLHRRLRLPLPRRRARRHVDDGPDGGGRMIRRRRSSARSPPLALCRRGRRRPPSPAPSRRSTRRRSARSGRRSTLPAQVGDTIEWRFTQPGNPNASTHDIWLVAARRAAARSSARPTSAPTAPRTVVNAAGTYQFYCSIHGGLDARRA